MSHIHTQRRLSVVLIVAMFISMVPTAAAPTGPIRELTAIESSHPVSYEFDPSAQVSVVAPVAPVVVGETFTVTVTAAQVDTPLSAFQFELSYDPLLLDFVHAAEGSFLSSTGRAAVCPTPAKGEGMVRLACASTGPMRGPTGEGALALLTFRARSDGESDLILGNVQLPDDGRPPVALPATLQNGHVTLCAQMTGVSFGYGPPEPLILSSVVFTATYAPLDATEPITYTWDFGDGQVGSGQVTSHSYEIGDDYSVTVTATNVCCSRQSTDVVRATVRYDVDRDCDVDIVDIMQVVKRWGCRCGDPCYDDPLYDLDGDCDVDVEDILEVAAQWRWRCSQPLVSSVGVLAQPTLTPVVGVSSAVTTAPVINADYGAMPRLSSSPTSGAAATSRAFPSLSRAVQAQSDDYWADIDGDHDVDIVDLQVMAGFWNCTSGQPCYDAAYDRDSDGGIDALDLATLGNEYDVEPPEVVITAPPEGAAVGETSILVSGTVSDTHTITSVTVNDVAATLAAGQFEAEVPLASGNQIITVVAEDELGAASTASRLVAVDADGPQIEVVAPQDRQSVYTATPDIEISYSDFFASVDTSTLSVQLEAAGGGQMDVTSDLTVKSDRAYGSVSTPLQQDTSYTLTISLQDTFANETVAQTTFYVPPDPDSITPPAEPEDAGWISGVIYDSSTCDEHLTTCQGLAGVRVTMEQVDVEALQRVRAARQRQIAARLATRSKLTTFTPLAPAAVNVTSALSGTVVTGPDGFFAFPLAETGDYWLRAEKDGYTYGQREAEVVQDRSTATNAIYLAPLDPAETPCDDGGCTHTSSDGMVEVEIPPDAIPSGEVVTTTATNFEQVEFLPSGDLPGDTWETYAFNLGGDSDYVFQEPITVRLKNELGFSPGTEVPLGYWNQATQAWEHAGTGVVDATGQWVEMEATHFSNYDCNDPIAPPADTDPDADDESNDDEDPCEAGDNSCFISLKSGTFEEDITLPTVNVLGEEIAPALLYNSNQASPAEVIDVKLSLDVGPGAELGDYIGFELYIEGQKTDSFVFSSTLKTGEMGRYRYLWNGRDAQGDLLPPGVYEYAVKFSIPYRGQYCYALDGIFGNPPDCEFGATGVFVDATEDVWVRGTIESNAQPDSPLGAGWVLDGLQRLYEDQAGRIMAVDGQREDEFYFPQKDLSSNADTSRLLAGPMTAPLLDTSTPQPTTELPLLEPLPETTLPVPERSVPELVRESEPPAGEPVPEAIAPSPEAAVARPQPPQLEALPPYQETPLSQGALACGEIITDTVWTAATATYTVTCDVSVQAGVTLTVEPGVIVQFEHSGDDLMISGGLQAVGTEVSPIVFQPVSGTMPGSWGRLAFLTGSSGILDHTVLEYGGSDDGLLYLASDQVQVTSSVVQYSDDTGIVIDGASPLISNSQILSNTGTYGGGLYNGSGNPTIQNNTFQGNSASRGGGIYNDSGSLTIQNNTFQGNSASDYGGGGIYNRSGSPTIQDNTFQDNSATGYPGGGGGIYNDSGSPTIQDNAFQDNSVSYYGGGLCNGSGSPTIQDNTFQDNSATHYGGGLYNGSGSPTIQNNTVVSNSADWGGGIYNDSGSPTIQNNTFQGDSASRGGGVYNDSGSPTIQNNTFQGNSADSGGGIEIGYYGSPTIRNNIVVSNSADWGGGIYSSNFDGSPTIHNNIVVSNSASSRGGGIYHSGVIAPEADYNDVWNNDGGDYAGVASGPHDISADPLFVDAPGGNLHLSPDSPCIDAGAPDSYADTDFEGDPRPMGPAPDIGADEYRTLGVPKSAPTSVEPGETFTYSVGLVNLGTLAATDVVVTDVLPVEVAFLSYQADGIVCAHDGSAWGGTLYCTPNGDSLLPGETRGLTLTVVAADTLPASRPLTNVISGTARAGGAGLAARDQAETWVTWCGVRLNDGPVGADIQAAIDASTQPTDVVRVSGRCLVHDVALDKTLTLQGGWSRDFNVRDPTVYTILDAQRMGRVLRVSGDVSPTIEGFFITGGVAVWGGGIRNYSGSPIIQNNTFQGNYSVLGLWSNGGGGICNGSGSPTIQDNTFQDNSVTGYSSGGGGIYNSSGSPTIQNNTFQGNSASRGGGLYNGSGSPTIRSNIIVSNTADSGAGIYSSGGLPDVDYNDVWNNGGGNYEGVTPGPHDISADPSFVDALGGDLHLSPDSPCIDAGAPDSYAETDFEGDPRPMGPAPDIGADEYRTLGVPKSAPTSVEPGETFTYSVGLVNLGTLAATDVVVTDVLPVEVAFLSYQADGIVCTHDGSAWGGTLYCTPDGDSLLPGETRGLTLTVVATDALPASRPLTNVISGTARAGGTGLAARDQVLTWISWCAVRLNDGPVGTDLQAAIDASTQPTDVVRVSGRCLIHDITLDKTLILQGGWSQDFSVRDTTVHTATLDAQGMGRVLLVSGDVSPTIEGFFITGGGIYNDSGSPIIQNNTFQGNSANDDGAGIYNDSGSPTIQSNTFQGNLANDDGAGIYNDSGSPTIQSNTFQGNSANDDGAGIYNDSGSPTIQSNTFQGNSATGYGGGIINRSGSPAIQNNTFQGNSADWGGGIYNDSGSPTIQNNTFQGNSASRGGGIFNAGGGSPTIQNNTFQGNSARSSGGGICNGSGNPTIQNNTFQGNSGTYYGGGIFNWSGSPTIQSNTFQSNSATSGGGIYNYSGSPTVDYNDVWDNGGGDYYGVSPGPHDISADPLFVDAEGGDFHLATGSPCIDAGDPDNYPETDFEGDPRPMGLAPDIGADEFRGEIASSRTATDYSILTHDSNTATYTRVYPDGSEVHFNPDGTHDFTLEPGGRKTVYAYNPDGTVATMGIIPTGEDAPRWTWIFDYADGKLSSITDPAGRVTSFTVNTQDNLSQVTTPDNATQSFAYDANHLMTHYTDQNSAVTTHAYDSYGRITSITEPTRTVYDPATGQTEVTQEVRYYTPSDTAYPLINDSPVGDPDNPAPPVPVSGDLMDGVTYGRGGRSGHTNKWGNWLDETDGEGRTTLYQYDDANNVTSMDYPDGDCVAYTYDDLGNLLSESRMEAAQCALDLVNRAPAQAQGWTFTYEERFNQLKTLTDPLGHTITFILDYEKGVGETGNLVQVLYPPIIAETGILITPTLDYSYNAWGLLDSETDLQGNVAKYIYTQGTPDEASDGANPLFAPGVTPVPGLLTQVIEDYGDDAHLNLTTTFKDFDASSNPGTIVDPRGAVYYQTYDDFGRILTMENDLGFVIRYEYDGRGNLVQLTEGYTPDGTTGRNRVTTYAYDPEDRLLSWRTEADGMVSEIVNTYDVNGELATLSDAYGRTIAYTYDEADQLVAQVDPLGQTTAYSYTLKGELAGVIYPDGRALGLAYDARGNPTVTSPPGRPAHSFEYDARGLVTAYVPPAVGASGDDTRYGYNAFRLLTGVTRPDNRQILFAYDEGIHLSSLTLPRGRITYGYDPATSQLTTISAPGNVTLTLLYDGDVVTQTTWTGVVNGSVGQTYDNYYRVTTQNVNGGAPIQFQYTADHLLTQAGDLSLTYKHQSGLLDGTTLGNVSDTRDYNAFGEPVHYAATADGASLYDVQYAYDQLAGIETITETVSGESHVYNYTFDSSGRLVQVRKDGALISTYTYDDNGNRLTGPSTYDDQDRLIQYEATTYTYTANGELQAKITAGQTTTYTYDVLGNLMGVSLPDGTQIDYVIDGQNRRVGKRVDGVLVQGFLYQDELNPIAELDGGNSVVATFIYGSRTNVPDYMLKGGAIYRIIANHLGSPRLVVDVSTGTIAQRMDYDGFGNVIQDTNLGFQPFGFAGGIYDQDTGLVRFGARDYDPQTGRWTTKDPILFAGDDTNLYGYVFNDPINWIDPSGEFIGSLIGAGTSVLTGWAIAKLTGDCYTWRDALLDAGIGAAGVGILSKFRKLHRVTKLRNVASKAGMGRSAAQRGMEKYVGSHYARMEIKHVGNILKPKGGFNPQTSWVPRARMRVAKGLYADPFTGAIGPRLSDVAHIPLATLPLTEAPLIGGAAGATGAARRTASDSGCGCN